MLILICFMPESPAWLYEKKRYEECMDVFQIMAYVNGEEMEMDGSMYANIRKKTEITVHGTR